MNLLKYIVTIIVTAGVIGGGTYYLVHHQSQQDQAALNSQISDLQSQVNDLKSLTNNTTAKTSDSSPTATISSCQTSSLATSLTDGSGAAGTYYFTLNIKNTGTVSCLYSGASTISLLDSNSVALGSTKVSTTTAMTITAGNSVYATVGFPDYSVYGSSSCKTGATTLAVYAPNQTTAATVKGLDTLRPGFTNYYCPGFTVGALGATKP